MLALQRSTLEKARENLSILLSLVEAGKIRCSEKTRQPTAATMRLIQGCLSGGDFYPDEHIQSFAWPLLLQTGGLASGARMMLTVKGKAALKRDPDEVLAELWERWLRKGSLDEISRIEEVKGKTRTNVLSALAHRRIAASHSLKLLPAGGFLGIDELFAAAMKHSPFTCSRN